MLFQQLGQHRHPGVQLCQPLSNILGHHGGIAGVHPDVGVHLVAVAGFESMVMIVAVIGFVRFPGGDPLGTCLLYTSRCV